MKKQIVAIAIAVAVTTQLGHTAPTPREIHERGVALLIEVVEDQFDVRERQHAPHGSQSPEDRQAPRAATSSP
jgi:hypothetical protein